MIWNAIGGSVIGTSHVAADKGCEDAIHYKIATDPDGGEVLICCISDGAGSAQFAAQASEYATRVMTNGLELIAESGHPVTEGDIYALAEDIYDGLAKEAEAQQTELNEYSCTLLGCYITATTTAFFQVGDGAIVRNDGNGFYIPVWWPDNGEYQNTTSFIIDDKTLSNLNILVLDEPVSEVAIFSDGLQLLALNTESRSAHQPFFTDMFRFLRMAGDIDKINVLNAKLTEYLNSAQINARTDDDKTLFLGTRITA